MHSAAKKAAFVAAFFISGPALALDRAAVDRLVNGEGDERIAAIAALLAEGDPKAADLLKDAAQGEITLDGKSRQLTKSAAGITCGVGATHSRRRMMRTFRTSVNTTAATTHTTTRETGWVSNE